jgi:DNA-binding transcriptional MerR regulator
LDDSKFDDWMQVTAEQAALLEGSMPTLASITLEALSERSGVDIETIGAYQRQGLIQKPRRVARNLALYQSDCIERVMFIRHALHLGFSPEAVHELLLFSRNARS